MPSCVPKMKGKISSCKAEVAQHVPGFSIPGNPSDFYYHLKVLRKFNFQTGLRALFCTDTIEIFCFQLQTNQEHEERSVLM